MHLKAQVGVILEHWPETRSCDTKLVARVWRTFYSDLLVMDGQFIELDKIAELPSVDNITRYRRMLSPVYPPTADIARHRKRIQKEKRFEFGMNDLTDIL